MTWIREKIVDFFTSFGLTFVILHYKSLDTMSYYQSTGRICAHFNGLTTVPFYHHPVENGQMVSAKFLVAHQRKLPQQTC